MTYEQLSLPGWQPLAAPSLWQRLGAQPDRNEFISLTHWLRHSAARTVEALCEGVSYLRDTPEQEPRTIGADYAAQLPADAADALYRREPSAVELFQSMIYVINERERNESIDTLVLQYGTLPLGYDTEVRQAYEPDEVCNVLANHGWAEPLIDAGFGYRFCAYAELCEGVLPSVRSIYDGRTVRGPMDLDPITPEHRRDAIGLLREIAPSMRDRKTVARLDNFTEIGQRMCLTSLLDQIQQQRYVEIPRPVVYVAESRGQTKILE